MTEREELSQLFFREIMTKPGKEKSIVLKWSAPTQKECSKYITEITYIAINQRNLLFDEKGGVKRSTLEHIWYNCVTMKPTLEKIIKQKLTYTTFNTFLEFVRQKKNYQQIRHARAYLQELLDKSDMKRNKKYI